MRSTPARINKVPLSNHLEIFHRQSSHLPRRRQPPSHLTLWTSYSTKKTLLLEVQELPLNGHNNYIALVLYAVSRISALVPVHFFLCAVYDKAFLVLCQNYCVLGEFRILWQLLFQTIQSSGASYIVLGKSGLFPIKQILNLETTSEENFTSKVIKIVNLASFIEKLLAFTYPVDFNWAAQISWIAIKFPTFASWLLLVLILTWKRVCPAFLLVYKSIRNTELVCVVIFLYFLVFSFVKFKFCLASWQIKLIEIM